MYLAELHGKLSQAISQKEDLLTSNVFSFFKYTNRIIFLKEYLNFLNLKVSDQDAIDAEFIFWPTYGDDTEPDLVIIIGRYYLLIEAKYISDFSGETQKSKAQIIREIDGGKHEAANYRKIFKYIAITADHYYKEDKFKLIPSEFKPHFIWDNWQSISSLLKNILDSNARITAQEKEFACDLYRLLDKKCLRGYRGILSILKKGLQLNRHQSVFFEAETAKYRGDFIGFLKSLSLDCHIEPVGKAVFFIPTKQLFSSLSHLNIPLLTKQHIFFRRT